MTAGTPAAQAVKRSTGSVLLVMVAVGDPVEAGLVRSLRFPGGNVTGLMSWEDLADHQHLLIARDLIPGLSQVAAFTNSANASLKRSSERLQRIATRLKIKVQVLDVRSPDELDAAFHLVAQNRPQVLLVPGDGVFLTTRTRIAEFAMQRGLPSMHAYREFVAEGGLLSLGPNYAAMHRRAAWYVDRILGQGTKAGDLPVEEPWAAQFELVINLKTAKALGLTIPPSLLARADEVIE